MNNWRLLLLAVVAVLQPIGSYTERNVIDGRQECCDHRSNTVTQETRPYENSRENTPDNRRLSSGNVREDRRRSDVRNDWISSRERLTTKRTERRVSPEFVTRVNIEARFVSGKERRQNTGDARESRQAREVQIRRNRESVSRDSLSRYERDALDSRRIRMSRSDARTERVSNERVFRELSRSQDKRTVPAMDEFRHVSVSREDTALRRERHDVARFENRRISTSRAENRLQHDNNKESHNLDQRVRVDTFGNRRSRSLESRINSFERDHQRTTFRTISERVDIRSTDQNREPSSRILTTFRDSSERILTNHRLESRDVIEPVNQSRRNIKEYRAVNERTEVRDSSSLRRGREVRQNNERRQSSRESLTVDTNLRPERIVRSNERRQETRALRMSDETRQKRRQSLSRSLDRVRSSEREFTARIPDRTTSNRRDLRSEERLDERREQHYRTRMSRDRQTNKLRDSRDSSERRQEIRSAEVKALSELESGYRERYNVRSDNRRDLQERTVSREHTLNRMGRDTRNHDDQLSRNSRFAARAISNERVFRIRDDIRRENRKENRDTNFVIHQLTRDISTPQQKSDTRRIVSNTLLQRARTLEDILNEKREVTERDESRAARARISMNRFSRDKIDRREAQETSRYSRVDSRNEIMRNRGVQINRKESHRLQDNSRSQDRVLQRQARAILTSRSTERPSRETTLRAVELRSEQLSKNNDERNTNERNVRDAQEFRTIEARQETRRIVEREVQPNRHNLAMDRRTTRDINIEAKSRSSDIVLAEETRADTRRDARDTRFRSFTTQVHEIKPMKASDDQNQMSWQMVFYTLQGAYLCGLLMQMLTEKSNKGKSRNITAWWSPAPKDLVKIN